MSVRNMVAIGFFSVMAAIGIMNASDSVASDASRADLIEERVGHGGSVYFKRSTTGQTGECGGAEKERNRGELVEERIGHGGSMYFKRSMSGQPVTCDSNFYSQPIAH